MRLERKCGTGDIKVTKFINISSLIEIRISRIHLNQSISHKLLVLLFITFCIRHVVYLNQSISPASSVATVRTLAPTPCLLMLEDALVQVLEPQRLLLVCVQVGVHVALGHQADALVRL